MFSIQDTPFLPNVTYAFTIRITNPPSPFAAPSLTSLRLAASGSAVIAPTQLLQNSSFAASNSGTSAPSPASSSTPQAVNAMQIGQTNPFPLANNTLTVTLVSSVNLTGAGGCVVTVTGLAGAATEDTSQLPIGDTNDSGLVQALWGPHASWRHARGSLLLTLRSGQTMIANTTYILSFRLVNPAVGQPPPEVSVISSGSPSVEAVRLPHDLSTLLPLAGLVQFLSSGSQLPRPVSSHSVQIEQQHS